MEGFRRHQNELRSAGLTQAGSLSEGARLSCTIMSEEMDGEAGGSCGRMPAVPTNGGATPTILSHKHQGKMRGKIQRSRLRWYDRSHAR